MEDVRRIGFVPRGGVQVDPQALSHFKGVLEKLLEVHVDAIRRTRPQANASKEERVDAYQSMDDYLARHSKTLYPKGATARNCILHPGKECKLRWTDPPHLSSAERPITFGVFWPPCRSFTLYGNRLGRAHEDMETIHVCRHDINASKLDVVMFENSDHCEQSLFMLPEEDYDNHFAIFGSQDQGWPVRRARFYSWSILRDHLVWIGPSSKDVLIDFLTFFGALCVSDVDVFVGLEGEDANVEALMRLARNRAWLAEGLSGHRPPWPQPLVRQRHDVATASCVEALLHVQHGPAEFFGGVSMAFVFHLHGHGGGFRDAGRAGHDMTEFQHRRMSPRAQRHRPVRRPLPWLSRPVAPRVEADCPAPAAGRRPLPWLLRPS